MPSRLLLLLPCVAMACSAGTADTELTPAQTIATRDSVRTFLDAYAADLSAPPLGKKAREALAPFYAADIVMSMDLAPDEPVLVQTIDSMIPADEVVSQPAWIKSTRFEWGTMVITPLAPGLASYTAKYAEHVTDTTGAVTTLPGVQHGTVRSGTAGWRIVSVQSSHPMATHERQATLVARHTPPK